MARSRCSPGMPRACYLRRPPFLDDAMDAAAPIRGARMLLMLGDDITTDHISPGSTIPPSTEAAAYLIEHGVTPQKFGTYIGRRANHEVMIRGTFANIRLRNELAPDREGGFTRHQPSGEMMTVFDAAERYRAEGRPVVVVGGRNYGCGSSRDWAAKGTRLLGVRAVIAESFERIHRSNLVGMGVLPLQFPAGISRHTLGLTGDEAFDIPDIGAALVPGREPFRSRSRARPGPARPCRSSRASTRGAKRNGCAMAASCRMCSTNWERRDEAAVRPDRAGVRAHRRVRSRPLDARLLPAARQLFLDGVAVAGARLEEAPRRAEGRTSAAQITQYRAVSYWGLQFAACGGLAYREAKARGLGRELPTEWFLQSIKN